MNRIELSVFVSNARAQALYAGLGFQTEGLLPPARFKKGRYEDSVVMSLLRAEYGEDHED